MWDVVVMGGRVLISVVVLAVGLGSALGEDWPGFHGARRDNDCGWLSVRAGRRGP